MQSLYPQYPNNERFLSSCTHRLLQLQSELQTQHLKQELISSLTMKELSLKKLIEEQNLLICYLQDELKELQIRKSQEIQMEIALIELQEKYLALGELKSLDLAENEKILIGLKTEYNQLHYLLNQLTKQTSTLYELKIKLSQRKSFTKTLLTQKILQYSEVKEKHQHQFCINSVKKHQKTMLESQNEKIKAQNAILASEFDSKNEQIELNKIRLISLQQEVKKYEQKKTKLIEIQNAAQHDNLLLKQTLKEKIQIMKQKEQNLNSLNQQKQTLTQQKLQETQRLEKLTKENDQNQISLTNQLANGQVLKSKHEILLKDKLTLERQLSTLQEKSRYFSNMKKTNLAKCLQRQQNLEKNLYFTDQYMLINSELINQIQILLNEEINKNVIYPTPLKRQQSNRPYEVLRLKEFLSQMRQQIHLTSKNVELLTKDFHSYKIL